jgi:hypothetical protein
VIERVRALRSEQNVLVWGSPTLVQLALRMTPAGSAD